MFKRTLLHSFKFAVQGFIFVVRKERNMRTHLLAAALAIALGAFLHISRIEWLFLNLAITVVFIAEIMNTAFEQLMNYANGKRYHHIVQMLKDIAAGGVLIAVLNALATAYIIFIPFIKK